VYVDGLTTARGWLLPAHSADVMLRWPSSDDERMDCGSRVSDDKEWWDEIVVRAFRFAQSTYSE
jgi:hypothetical protein